MIFNRIGIAAKRFLEGAERALKEAKGAKKIKDVAERLLVDL